MWSAIRSDLTEFVSTVQEESSNVLTSIDSSFPDSQDDLARQQREERLPPSQRKTTKRQNISMTSSEDDAYFAAEEEALRRIQDDKTFTTPLSLPQPEEEKKAGDEDEGEKQEGEEKNQSEDVDGEGEYIEEDEEEVKLFLESFSIDSKTDDISQLLSEDSSLLSSSSMSIRAALKTQFESLVPTTVSYEDFWKRYYFRCDVNRIVKEMAEEEERAREARAEALGQSIDTVRNFLGGAVKAVSAPLMGDEAGGQQQQTSGVSLNIFGTTGRPPFVMNTAVDEDEDNEEEELGWDDDDDEEEEVDLDAGANQGKTEEIEFKDAETEKLQEQLKQALEERDQLHQTVEMQLQEIASLRSGGDSSAVESLKIKLFEKESELAAVKASRSDGHEEEHGPEVKDAKLQEMQALVKESNQRVQELLAMQEKDKAALESARARNKELETKLASMSNAPQAQSSADSAQLQETVNSLQEALSAMQAKNMSLQAKLDDAEERATSSDAATTVRNELEQTKAQLVQAEKRAKDMDLQLQKAKQEESSAETAGRSYASPDSASSAVKVESPAPVVKVSVDEEELEDDWGDEW